MALPLGELSPQVTERVLQSFLNDNINLFTHITEISVDITVGESQNLLGCYPLGMVIVCPLRPRCARPPLPRGEARNARAVHQRERQDVFPGTSPLRALAALGHLSQGERQDVFPGTFPLRALAALGHLSQGERQGMLARYTERCIEVRPLVPEGILSVCQTGSCPYAKFTCQSQNKQSPLPKKWSILYKTRGMLIECYSVN